MADVKQPGALLAAYPGDARLHVGMYGHVEAPSPRAAARIAERVNQTWREAWADEIRCAPQGIPDASKALRQMSDHSVLELMKRAADLASRKPEDMERSEWQEGERVPWADGVYEVEWDNKSWRTPGQMRESTGRSVSFAKWACGYWTAGCRTVDEAVRNGGRAVCWPIRWRGITQAQARALGAA